MTRIEWLRTLRADPLGAADVASIEQLVALALGDDGTLADDAAMVLCDVTKRVDGGEIDDPAIEAALARALLALLPLLADPDSLRAAQVLSMTRRLPIDAEGVGLLLSMIARTAPEERATLVVVLGNVRPTWPPDVERALADALAVPETEAEAAFALYVRAHEIRDEATVTALRRASERPGGASEHARLALARRR